MNEELRGMPESIQSEKLVLGSILLDGNRFTDISGILTNSDFALESHRRILLRMAALYERGEKIDRVTVMNELQKFNELESVGIGYLNSLDDGMPQFPNIDSYVKIIRDKAVLRRIAVASQQIMNRALDGNEDPQELLESAERSLLQLGGEAEDSIGLLMPLHVIQQYEGGINSFLDPSKRPKGIQTGFTKLDQMTTGFKPAELIVLAARPSMGKTAMALNIAWHVAARQFKPVAIFSLEMSRESLITRMLCAAARVDSQRFRAGYLNENERMKMRGAANTLVELEFHIDDTAGVNLMQMHSRLRKLQHQLDQPIGLVVVDYLQLMGSNRNENRNQEVSYLSQALKNMSKEFGCPFLVLSQLSRAPETRTGDHRPMLSDLRESGAIEQDADIVMFIFREEVYKRDREDLRGVAELLLAKQRNGPVGKIDLIFLHSMTKFENRAEDLEGAE